MRSKSLRSFAAAARLTAASLFIGAAGVANAQKAALVQNVDEAARQPYQEQMNCSYAGSNVCRFNLKAVPAGHRREVRLVSCYAQVNQPGTPGATLTFQSVTLYATIPTYVGLSLPFQSRLPGTPYNGMVYAQTSMFFEPGDVPFIQLLTSEIIGGGSCTVTGHEIAIP